MKYLLAIFCILFVSCASSGGGYVVGNGLAPQESFEEKVNTQQEDTCACKAQKKCACSKSSDIKKN